MKKAIKRFFLKVLLFFIVVGMLAVLGGILINSRVVGTTEENILYVCRDDAEIKQFARENLKDLGADCALVLGCGILAFGMSIVIRSNSGTGPNDLVAIILSDYVNRKFTIAFRWVRIISDAVFVAAGFLMGGIVGVGTIAAVVLIGPMVQFFLPISGKLIQKCFPSLS